MLLLERHGALRRAEKMKRFLFVLAVIGCFLLPLSANMRPPSKIDGFLSGSIRNLPLSAAVKLLREELLFAFPLFQDDLSPDAAMAGITVRYEIVNLLSEAIEVPVQFLAVDIQNLTAALDGQTLTVEMISGGAEKSECLWRLARHRSGFMHPLYGEFLGRIRAAAGLVEARDAEWLAALERKDLTGADFQKIFLFSRSWTDTLDFRSASLRLRLRPGAHVLQIAYSQRMFIDERGYGYTSSWPKKGFSGVDYLLYPATSWPLDPGFRLSVDVEIPEMPVTRLFLKKRLKPFTRSNLPLLDAAAERAHVRHLHGEFGGFPADVLTVLVWFDPKALRYIPGQPSPISPR